MWRITSAFLIFSICLLVSCGGLDPVDKPVKPIDEPDNPIDGPDPVPEGKLRVGAQGAAWVAYQDGEGEWQVLSGQERYEVSIGDADGRYGAAQLCLDEADEVSARLSYATLAKQAEVVTPCSSDETEPDFYTLFGTVSGLAAGETGLIYGGSQVDLTQEDSDYSLAGFVAGDYDIVVSVHETADLSKPPSKILLKEVSIKEDQPLDLDLSEATQVQRQKVSLENTPDKGEVSGRVSLLTKRGTRAALGFTEGDTLTFDYAALPALSTTYELQAQSLGEDEQGELVSRALTRTFTEPGDLTLSLPDPLKAATLKLADGRPTLMWSAYTEGADYRVVFESGAEESETRYVVFLDHTWLGASVTDLSYTVPNFSGLSGWQETWTLDGAEPFWELTAQVEGEREVLSVGRSSAVQP